MGRPRRCLRVPQGIPCRGGARCRRRAAARRVGSDDPRRGGRPRDRGDGAMRRRDQRGSGLGRAELADDPAAGPAVVRRARGLRHPAPRFRGQCCREGSGMCLRHRPLGGRRSCSCPPGGDSRPRRPAPRLRPSGPAHHLQPPARQLPRARGGDRHRPQLSGAAAADARGPPGGDTPSFRVSTSHSTPYGTFREDR